jgi:fructoselysine-6-P-deglycase FrlB-like protein
METMCIPTMFSDIEEFSHGMHRSVKENSFVMLLNSKVGRVDTMKTFNFFKDKGVNVMIINAGEVLEDANVINVGKANCVDNVLSITAAIQVISAFVPELNGMDPNRDANNDYTDCVSTRV